MSRRLLIRTCILVAVSTQVRSQFDFFERFNSFLQPLVTTKPKNEVTKRPDTKHRQTNKLKYQDLIFFETDDFLKRKESSRTIDPFNLFSTTVKPRRKNTKTSTTSHSRNSHTTQPPNSNKPNKPVDSNKIDKNNKNINHEVIRSISSNNNVDNRVVNNARRIDNYNGNGYNDNGFNGYGSNVETTTNRASNNNYGYQGNNYNVNNANRQTTQKPTEYYNNARQTTQKPAEYYNNARQTTQKPAEYYNNARQTTQKPAEYYNNARQTTQKPAEYYNNARQTTQKPAEYYNNARQTTQKPAEYYNNARQTTRNYEREITTRRPTNNRDTQSYTTTNPLLHRPGVKPAAVDENKPPITNRPVTSRPVTSRPVYDTASYRPPVNTRPPFEPERPISSGVVRPISSGVSRPVTSPTRPPGSEAGVDAEPEIEIGPDEDEMSDSEKRRLYDICEQKCDEYKSARIKKVVALPLSPNTQGVEVNVSSCAPNKIPLIIGGEVVQIQQFPHMALVGWKKVQSSGYSWKCGGSLVSERYVLTAGHCTYHDKDYNVVSGPPAAVQLGSSLYNDRAATVIRVAAVIRHPKYKIRRSYHDVALIRLAYSVTFSDTISPACLGVPPPVGEPIIATGWGKTEYGGDSSIELRSVSIPIWDMGDCREIWGTSLKLPRGPLPDNQICAGEKKGAKDTCQGDSGGPAQVSDGCAWRVVAVTSVGRSCGAPDTPALYATVPRAFIAAQIYTNAKTGRDGNNQYGNDGANGNNNRGNTNNNWSNANSNGNANNNWSNANSNGNANNNWSNANSNGNGNNNRGDQGVANQRPAQNNNGQNYGNTGSLPNNNNQYYGGNQGSGSDNRGINNYNNQGTNNGNNFDNNGQNTNNNYWSVTVPATTNNNRYNQNNNDQNNRNVYDQSNYANIAQIYRTTTAKPSYSNQNSNNGQNNYNNANNYGQNGYNNGQNQNRYNDNGNIGITYNNNGYNDYPVVSQPWWTK